MPELHIITIAYQALSSHPPYTERNFESSRLLLKYHIVVEDKSYSQLSFD